MTIKNVSWEIQAKETLYKEPGAYSTFIANFRKTKNFSSSYRGQKMLVLQYQEKTKNQKGKETVSSRNRKQMSEIVQPA